MTKYTGSMERYNLNYFFSTETTKESQRQNENLDEQDQFPIVRIPMPRYSLLVLYGSARYEWEHAIYRSDIKERRICMAYREFTPEYLQGGKNYASIGQEIISKAQSFWS